MIVFGKKKPSTGPIDQYGRPLNHDFNSHGSTNQRKFWFFSFLCFFLFVIIVLTVLLVVHFLNQNRLEIPKVTLSSTEWTKNSVIVTVDQSRGDITEFSFDDGKTWQESNQLEVFENQELVIQVRNSKGKVSKKVNVRISNIDNDLPELYFISPFYVSVNEEFDAKENVSVFDSGSGIVDYHVDCSKLDLTTPGEYLISYYVSDQIGNDITKVRKIVVEEQVRNYQYRFREISFIDSTCEYSCQCSELVGPTCPQDQFLKDFSWCCKICHESCQKEVYGEWSEWSSEKRIPSSSLEVEMKSESF